MDTAIALLLPLIGGFLFVKRTNFIKYEAVRESGHRFYFRVSYYGVFLFVASFIIFYFVNFLQEYLPCTIGIRAWLVGAVGPMLKDSAHAGAQINLWIICLFSVMLGRFVPYGVNRFSRATALQALHVAASKDALEALLIDSIENRKTIAITITSRKVYVGSAIGTAEPNEARKSIALLPLMSGYREEDGEVHFTTYYDWAFTGAGLEDAANFRIVLPIDRIASVSFFDVDVYEKFQLRHDNKPSKKPNSNKNRY